MARKKKEPKVDHCAIDPHFESMGGGLPDPEEDKPASVGELVLWRRVILRAQFDFVSTQKTALAKYNRHEAERWFLEGRMLLYVCQLADLDGHKLRAIMTLAASSRYQRDKLRARLTWG